MTALPYSRVLAEAAAWPFWAPTAFNMSLVALERSADGELGSQTADLAVALQEHLRLRAGGASLDWLRQVRDHVWFDGERTSIRFGLVTVLRRVAQQYLKPRHGDCTLKAHDGESAAETVHRFRWMTLALPRDLLVAAVGGHKLSPDLLLPTDSEQRQALQELLNRGLAEIHCHLSACLSFEALWTFLMTSAGSPSLDEKSLDATGIPFGCRSTFLSWLATAGLARLCIAGFLARRQRSSVATDGRDARSEELTFGRFLNGIPFDGSVERLDHMQALSALSYGQTPVPVFRIRPAYRRYLGRPSVLRPYSSLRALAESDPIFGGFSNGNDWPETALCRHGLAYLESLRGQADRGFERLFWQYQRVRCSTYRFVTEEPGTSGLDWFIRFFRRISPLRKGLGTRVLMDSAIGFQRMPDGQQIARLEKIEVRIAPADHWTKLKEDLCGIAKARRHYPRAQAERSSPLQLGVLLHFQKDRQDTVPRPVPRSGGSHGDGLRFVRFGHYFRARRKEAHAVEAMLMADPSVLRVLRGLDICGQELSTPTWVLLPLLRHLRRTSLYLENASRHLRQPIKPFRMTLHVGEDFRSLLEGLRRIHEPIEFGLLESQDRLGHAVALGIDPKKWTDANPVTYQPKEERLDDILWLLGLAESQLLCLRDKEQWQQSAYDLAEKIYAPLPGPSSRNRIVRALLVARHMRHRPESLAVYGYPDVVDREPSAADLAAHFFFRYLTDHSVWRRGQDPCEVSASSSEKAALCAAQRAVLNAVAARKLTIEANPSSNLIIANLDSLDCHPMFRLSPLGWRRWLKTQQRLALSDDDPLTFATSLVDEYAYTYHAIVRHNYSPHQALQWLEQRRKDAVAACFTLPESTNWPPGE